MYKYSIELFTEGVWIIEIRFYYIDKDLNDFDLHPVENKRRNVKLILWKNLNVR